MKFPNAAAAGGGAESSVLPRLRLVLSWLALLWERLWPALWPMVGIAGLFTAVWGPDMPPGRFFWVSLRWLATMPQGRPSMRA